MNFQTRMRTFSFSGLLVPLVVGAAVLGMAALLAPMAWSAFKEPDSATGPSARQSSQDVVEDVGDDLAEALERAAEERRQAQASQASAAWQLRCADSNDASTCNMNQELFLQQTVDGEQQTVGRLLNLTVVYLNAGSERVPFMSLQMPLGVDLRPGAVMRVDEQSETPLEFLRCTEAGCDASTRVTPDLLAQMRAGTVLRVGFRPWGSEQVTAVEASLIGFTAAFEQLR